MKRIFSLVLQYTYLLHEIRESKMNENILAINQTYSILEADKLDSELRILDWIFYQVCSNEIKRILT